MAYVEEVLRLPERRYPEGTVGLSVQGFFTNWGTSKVFIIRPDGQATEVVLPLPFERTVFDESALAMRELGQVELGRLIQTILQELPFVELALHTFGDPINVGNIDKMITPDPEFYILTPQDVAAQNNEYRQRTEHMRMTAQNQAQKPIGTYAASRWYTHETVDQGVYTLYSKERSLAFNSLRGLRGQIIRARKDYNLQHLFVYKLGAPLDPELVTKILDIDSNKGRVERMYERAPCIPRTVRVKISKPIQTQS